MGKLRQLNEQNKLAIWAERVTECRNSGQSVLAWCKEHGICSQTYYKWQKRLFTMAEAQHEVQFAEVTPNTETPLSHKAAISIHIAAQYRPLMRSLRLPQNRNSVLVNGSS